jgi:muramoyltetrapeptide carboxypeptidase
MRKPRALSKGDHLAVVAPASCFTREGFDAGIREIERLGLEPVYDDSVFARSPHGYVAGPAELRAAAIHRAWSDPSIAGVIAVRGGYGSAQVLPLLDRALAAATTKPFIGYSDLTAILTYLTLACGLVTFHGPMLDRRLGHGAEGYDRDSFDRVLFHARAAGELTAPGVETVVRGEASGLLIGGTVTQLLASLGTPFAFDPPPGYVLLFDEVGERPYRLDRMITQLGQSGLLARASAIVVGELPGCDEAGGALRGRAVVHDLLADFPGPVIAGFPSGHTTGPAMTVPFGVRCRVVADGTPRLVIEEAAVQ